MFNFGGGGGQPSAPASGGFSFGATPTTTTSSGFSFGKPTSATPVLTSALAAAPASAPSGFAFGSQPAATSSSGTTSGGFSFGATPTATTSAPPPAFGAAATTAAPGGLSFGAKPAATTTPSTGLNFGAPKTTAPATTAGGGFSFGLGSGAAPAKTTASVAPLGLTPASTGAVSFGAASTPASTGSVSFGAASTPASTATGSVSFGAATTTAASTAISFGAATTTASTAAGSVSFGAATTTTTTTAGGFGGFGLAASTSTPATTAGLSTATTTTQSISTVGNMTYRQLEEAINKWTLELEEQEKVFLNQATQVNTWDKLLMSNGEKIVTLNESVEQVKVDQQRLEHELDFVKGQQSELEDILRPLEASLASAPPPDAERERTYQLAESLDAQLQRMSDDLREIIEHLNTANKSHDDAGTADPVVQIGKVLNAHMDSLQWIDQTTSQVQRKLDEVVRLHDIRKRENERAGLF